MNSRPGLAGTAEEVVVVHQDVHGMMALTVALGAMRYRVTSAETHAALRTAKRLTAGAPAAMIVALDGTENVVEVRALLAAGARVRFIVLVPAMPPSAALNRIVTTHGSTILARDAPPVIIVSTLVALLASQAAHGPDA